jgi:DNA modification methylase
MLYNGDCLEVMKTIPECTYTGILTDPPYGLKFCNAKWDYDVPSIEAFTEMLRIVKPGGFLFCFGGSRTFHRMACNIEDAGWIIRDTIMWIQGQGMPKGHNIAKSIDAKLLCGGSNSRKLKEVEQTYGGETYELKGRNNGIIGEKRTYQRKTFETQTPEAQQWEGYSTALKPAFEPIIIAMKATDETFANNALQHGCSGMNIDAARLGEGTGKVLTRKYPDIRGGNFGQNSESYEKRAPVVRKVVDKGRWPPNVLMDEEAAQVLNEQVANASRFYYIPKAGAKEKVEGRHPTMKPLALMEQLVKLLSMPSQTHLLDPYMGSGTTLLAAQNLKIRCDGIERDEEFFALTKRRLGVDDQVPLFPSLVV